MAGKQGAEGAAKTKSVRLTAFYSGNGESLAPDTVVEFDAAEADRLIELGAAVEHKDEAKA